MELNRTRDARNALNERIDFFSFFFAKIGRPTPLAKSDIKHGSQEETKEGHAEHSEFHATYTISCEAPENVTGLETVYFANFAGAQLLNVNVTTSKGQTQAQMTRDKPRLDLTGVM